jgi:hypothetical protein
MAKSSKAAVVETCITDATVPDVSDKFTEVAAVSIMTPMGNPHDPTCTWGLPSIFWGGSGIAKSDRIKQVAASAGLICEVILPGQKQPEDFSGVPIPVGNGEVRVECLLPQVRKLNAAKRGILFIDEMSCATPATQGAMLGMVNDRIVGDVQFSPGIRVLGAANPPKLSAGGWALEAPMANRMAHFQTRSPTPSAWIAWLLSENVHRQLDVTLSETQLKAHWDMAYSHAKGLFAGFMHDRQVMLHRQPLSSHPQAGYCWASPRTWAMACRAVATINALGYDKTLESVFLEGCVGEGPAAEFLTWSKSADLPSPLQVLVKGWKPDNSRLDLTLAVLSSVTAYITTLVDPKEKYELAAAGWKFLTSVKEAGMPDLVIGPAQTLITAGLSRKGHDNEKLKAACEPLIYWLAESGMLKYVATQLDN